jgi:LytS/YehU family sensor histidine kinase
MDTRRLVERCAVGFTWQKILVAIVFCALYAVLLSMNPQTGGPPQSLVAYLGSFVAAAALFLPALVVATVAAAFAPRGQLRRALVLGIAVAFGVAIGFWLLGIVTTANVIPRPKGAHVSSTLPVILMAWLGLAVHLLREREKAAEQALHDEAERRLNLERQTAEAQLQVLQAQIEPHFLFNSLAHIRRLYQTHPAAARTMLRHLSRYLSATEAAVRDTTIALGQDLELAVAYLNIQQIRMGPRLAFEVNVPADLCGARVPSMTMTTLVENSIKHGLSPLMEGGVLRIDARRDGDSLAIDVADTGQGFQTNLGTGVGLANVRARLSILYGAAARLSLSENTPRGVIATVVVPVAASAT